MPSFFEPGMHYSSPGWQKELFPRKLVSYADKSNEMAEVHLTVVSGRCGEEEFSVWQSSFEQFHKERAGTYLLSFDFLSLLLEIQYKYYSEEMTFLDNPFQIGSYAWV